MHDARVLALDDGLLASVGMPGPAARAPEHVAFSPGESAELGWPQDVRHRRGA